MVIPETGFLPSSQDFQLWLPRGLDRGFGCTRSIGGGRRQNPRSELRTQANQFETRLNIPCVWGSFGENGVLTCDVVDAEFTESNADVWSMVCSLSSTTSSIFSPSLSTADDLGTLLEEGVETVEHPWGHVEGRRHLFECGLVSYLGRIV